MKLIRQDWLPIAGMCFKIASLFLTVWLIYSFPGIVYEKNPIVRGLLANPLQHALFQICGVGVLLVAYLRVRTKYLRGNDGKKAWVALNVSSLTILTINALDAFSNVHVMVSVLPP